MLSTPAFADIDLTGIAANPTDLSHLTIGQSFEVDFYARSTQTEFILSEVDKLNWDGGQATLDSWQTLPGIWDDLSTDPLVVKAFFTANALGTGSTELELKASTTGGSFDVFSNSVSFTVTPVPELSSIWLLSTLLVVAGLANVVRRRARGQRGSSAP